MENIFREKLDGFEPAHNDRWAQIADALPPEEKKRRFIWLWFGGAGLTLSIAVFLLLPNQKGADEKFAATQPEKTTVVPDVKIEESARPPIAEEAFVPSVSTSKPDTESTTSTNSGLAALSTLNAGSATRQISPGVLPQIPEKVDKEEQPIAPIDIVPEEDLKQNTPLEPENDKAAPLEEPVIESPIAMNTKAPADTIRNFAPQASKVEPQSKWSMGIGGGVYYTHFKQQMPKDIGNSSIPQADQLVQDNKTLREEIFKGGMTFTESIWVTYQPKPWISFRTGISMMQTSQNLSFDINDSVADPYRAFQDYNEGAVFSGTNNYLFELNRIKAGNTYTARSQYFAREIPFSFILTKKLGDRWSLGFEGGCSYRWITAASIYMPDIDNVGMLYLSEKDAYPGLKNTFNLHAGIGVQYKMGENFHLDIFPRFSYSMQSNIRYTRYVQQYQRNWGMEFRISRKLGF